MAFRVDASLRAGTGHVMRCLALAESLRERGAEVRFVCRDHKGHLAGLLDERRLPVSLLPARDGSAGGREGYADWLGAPEEADAAETIAALGGRRPDWLVVDHYAIDSRWEGALRPHVGRIIAIDDIANRAHDCDVLLDQNHSRLGAGRYAGLVAESCRMLLGPRYALLRAEYAAARAARRMRGPARGSLFVFFGGTDAANMTGRTLEALADARFGAVSVDIVVGANNPHRTSIERRAATRPRTVLHAPRTELASLMAQADLAIGAGGTTTWERLCVGVPSLLVALADNQVPACEALAEDGVVAFLGSEDCVGVEDIRAALDENLASGELQAERSLRGCALVDGLGTGRIVELLLPTDAAALGLRRATADDMFLYFGWVNDPETRRQSLRTAPVTLAEHRAWYEAKLESADSRLYVLQARGLPVGQIRFDRGPDGLSISYSIDPGFRGRGWAKRLVELGLREMREHGPAEIRATVKMSNPASDAVFRALGFDEICAGSGAANRTYRLRVGPAGNRSHAD